MKRMDRQKMHRLLHRGETFLSANSGTFRHTLSSLPLPLPLIFIFAELNIEISFSLRYYEHYSIKSRDYINFHAHNDIDLHHSI